MRRRMLRCMLRDHVCVSASGIAQGGEWNSELGPPAESRDLGVHVPHAIPVLVEPTGGKGPAFSLPGHLPVELDTHRVGAEDEPGELVSVGVEDDLKAVGLIQRRIAPAVGHDDLVGILVVADHPEVERGAGVGDENLGALRDRLTRVRGLLNEARGRRNSGPGRVVQDIAVESRRSLEIRAATADGRSTVSQILCNGRRVPDAAVARSRLIASVHRRYTRPSIGGAYYTHRARRHTRKCEDLRAGIIAAMHTLEKTIRDASGLVLMEVPQRWLPAYVL